MIENNKSKSEIELELEAKDNKNQHNLDTARVIVMNNILKRIQSLDVKNDKDIKELTSLYKHLQQLTLDDYCSRRRIKK